MKKILVLFVLGGFVNLAMAQTSPATKPATTTTTTTTTATPAATTTTTKKETPAKAKMEKPATTTTTTTTTATPAAKATAEKGEAKTKGSMKSSHKMKMKEHVCTAACKDGNHVYAHGEKGHVCTAACHPAKKASKATMKDAPVEKKG